MVKVSKSSSSDKSQYEVGVVLLFPFLLLFKNFTSIFCTPSGEHICITRPRETCSLLRCYAACATQRSGDLEAVNKPKKSSRDPYPNSYRQKRDTDGVSPRRYPELNSNISNCRRDPC